MGVGSACGVDGVSVIGVGVSGVDLGGETALLVHPRETNLLNRLLHATRLLLLFQVGPSGFLVNSSF